MEMAAPDIGTQSIIIPMVRILMSGQEEDAGG